MDGYNDATACESNEPAEVEPDLSNTEGKGAVVSDTGKEVAQRTIQPLPESQFPHKQITDAGSIKLRSTIENVEHLLDGYGITASYNVIAKGVRINIPGQSGCPDNADNSAITEITSRAALNGLPLGQIPMYLEAIADKNQVNPVMDYIQSKPWDGTDRIEALCETLETKPEFPRKLKRKLVRKWLISAVAAAASTGGFQSRGVLCLQGPQSIGKTRWILALIDDPLLRSQVIKIDHHLDPSQKDSVITAVTHWFVELGELDSSFKKDIARLKGFITADQDKVRRPYGRKDAVYPRRTVFIATVNHANFLVDDTGNTRWWTIPVIRVDHEHAIDMQQLWAQVYGLYQDGERWWLSSDEEQLLEAQNANHRAVSSIRDMVYSALDLNLPDYERRSMSASELLRRLDIKNPTNGQCRDCGSALREFIGEPKVSQGISRWRVPLGAPKEFDDADFDQIDLDEDVY